MQRYYSKLYWHFTGSPNVNWSNLSMPKDINAEPKSPKESIETLKAILTSQKLLATCTEKIFGDIKTDKFCCVCDIPFKDLLYHSEYYGQVALGFSAGAIHQNFNPVLYVERDFPIPGDIKIYEHHRLDEDRTFRENDSAFEYFSYLFGLEENDQYKGYLEKYLGFLKKFIKITKFSEKDDETFYREREWRSTSGDFNFQKDDIEAIIAPREFITEVQEHLKKCQYENHIPVIPFDFINKA